MTDRSREQQLIDLCFEIGLMTFRPGTDRGDIPYDLTKLSKDQKAEWIAEQLRNAGFDTVPCGGSWGVLKSPTKTSTVPGQTPLISGQRTCLECGHRDAIGQWIGGHICPRCKHGMVKPDQDLVKSDPLCYLPDEEFGEYQKILRNKQDQDTTLGQLYEIADDNGEILKEMLNKHKKETDEKA